MTKRRIAFFALAAATIVIGIEVRFGATFMPMGIADVLGDALWAFMVASLVSAMVPHWPVLRRAAIALCFAYVVEFSQLLHTPWLDDLRATTPGHLVLGQGFDARDLLAYFLGVTAFALVAEQIVSRFASPRS